MRILTRIKLIENQIKALKNKKRILVESIEPRAPEPPRATPEYLAAGALSKWAKKSGDNMAAVQLYILLTEFSNYYVPEELKGRYDYQEYGAIYDDIYDMITSLRPETYENTLNDLYEEEDAVDEAIAMAFHKFREMMKIGEQYCKYDVSSEWEVRETFWEKVAKRLRNTIEI